MNVILTIYFEVSEFSHINNPFCNVNEAFVAKSCGHVLELGDVCMYEYCGHSFAFMEMASPIPFYRTI